MKITNQDQYFLQLAIANAEKAKAIGEVPVGAVIVNAAGEVLAQAHNTPITAQDACGHAEINAIRLACLRCENYRLPDCTLYVSLEPCVMCTGALVHARIARVVFAARDYRAGACGTVFALHDSPCLNHRLRADFYEDADYIADFRAFFKARR